MAAAVRAKFYISGVTLLPGQQGGQVNLQACGRGARNAEWASATPCGSMQMTINNPDAFSFFEDFIKASRDTGRQPEVYIDIAVAQDGYPGDGHKFEEAQVPENHYNHGKCAQCGMPKDGYREGDESPHPNG